ncbi:MAG: hypothetical protein BroJett022_22670 [Actinomycetes bacterium]|nr:MAG: hypothetical protein BroJett022_22670 [Actinomycetes bacterium]
MSSRDRKRRARRKRKERGGGARDGHPAGGGGPDASEAADAADPAALAAAAEARDISRSELKDRQARERLEPLTDGERPLVVTIGAAVSLLIAASILIAWLAGVEVRVGGSDVEREPNLFQVIPPAILFAVMGVGMLGARYWAVLGFQAIMAIIMVGAAITLVAAATILQAVSLVLVLAIAATLFWFTVKALARIQMPSPGDRAR